MLKLIKFKSKHEVTESDHDIWSVDLQDTPNGKISFATCKANLDMMDYSEVEVCKYNTYAGIFTGHGGNHASLHVSQHIIPTIIDKCRQHRFIGEGSLLKAFEEVEKQYLNKSRECHGTALDMCRAGCSALIALINKSEILIANVGDARAVLGVAKRKSKISRKRVVAEELTVANEATGCIGELVKKESVYGAFHEENDLSQKQVTPKPNVYNIAVHHDYRFLVLGSKVLWEYLSMERVVTLVSNGPKKGIAGKVVAEALEEVGLRLQREMENEEKDMGNISLFDDITVVVVFFGEKNTQVTGVSYRPYEAISNRSQFQNFFERAFGVGGIVGGN